MKVTDEMVNRFLSWSLPKDFAPDGGIRYAPAPSRPDERPVGTNLLTAEQARAMLEHVLASHNSMPEFIEKVKVLSLAPDDILVLRLDRPVSMEVAERLKQMAARGFEHQRVMVLEKGVDVEVISKEALVV